MNFTRLINPPAAGVLLAIFATAASLPTQAHAARNKIYSCNDSTGARVFQDQPCGTSLKPWERDLTDRTRWTNPVRTGGGCAVRSPTVALTWLRADAPITFEGGVALVLNADESGIAANIVVEAAWPAPAQTDAMSADAISANANGYFQTPNQTTSSLEAATDGAATVAEELSNIPSNRKLELSGNIAGQAIVPDGHTAFVVDSMDDPTRMRYGYRQTSGLLRALKRAAALKFRLTLRSPEVSVISDSLELNGLEAAVTKLTRCADR